MQFLFDRGNDLTEFFWPILQFVKDQVLQGNGLPLWNNLFMAGSPLVSDPQAPIFYPFNLLALIMPLDYFYTLSLIFHIVLAGVTMYLCSKHGFGFSKRASIIVGLLYMFTPRLGAYLEAGHVGLVYSLAWIPLALLASLKLRKKPNIKSSILFATSLALIYYCHLPTFLIVAVSFGLAALNKKTVKYLLLSAILTFGLTAVSLLPQIAWQPYSTRYLLSSAKEVHPIWTSPLETIKSIFIANVNTEKAIVLGTLPVLLAMMGLAKLKSRQKAVVFGTTIIFGLVVLNNASPLYELLLNQKWYLLLRVSTRVWIIPTLLAIYLIGLAIEKYKHKFIYVLGALAVVESIYWGGQYLVKPAMLNPNLASKGVYGFLAKDTSIFRVYCLERCISQRTANEYNLELLDGYSTVQQTNFYKHAWQLIGAYWNYYTLSIPPFGADTSKPDIKSLGEYNVKYIITKTIISDKNLTLKDSIDGYLIYENMLSVPRGYEVYTPNHIRVRVNGKTAQLVIPEVYSPGWIAYLDGNEVAAVQETPNALRAVDIKPNTKFVDFKYSPGGFGKGKYITIFTLVFLIGHGLFQKIKISD